MAALENQPSNNGLVEITDELAVQFVAHISAGVESWIKAGKLLVQMVDRNPNTYKIINKFDPRISIDTLICFERIGRGEIYPQLLLDNSAGAKRLLHMPYNLQCKYALEKVQVVTSIRGNEAVVEEKHVHELTPKEIAVVFAPDKIRSPKEQVPMVEFNSKSRPKASATTRKRKTSIGHFRIDVIGGKAVLVPVARPVQAYYRQFEVSKNSRGGISTAEFEVFQNE